MECFSTLYNKALREYLQVGSTYSKVVTTGWPESSATSLRSNEIEKSPEDQDKNLYKYPSHMVVNAILLMKWFLMDHNLWEKSKLLKTKWE